MSFVAAVTRSNCNWALVGLAVAMQGGCTGTVDAPVPQNTAGSSVASGGDTSQPSTGGQASAVSGGSSMMPSAGSAGLPQAGGGGSGPDDEPVAPTPDPPAPEPPPAEDPNVDPDPSPGTYVGPADYEGKLPPLVGGDVGPVVEMDCPEDPTQGFTEYEDTFHIDSPYDLPISERFSIENGIYDFWVMQGDKRHNPDSNAPNPRTEASWSGRFQTGTQIFSADVYWDQSVSNGTVVMQVKTTASGIGPVYMVAEGANVRPINGSDVPGGLYDRWINLKVQIDADTTASKYWVNNCLVRSEGSGTRGNGNNYFKIGVYHCDSGTCRARVKNIHLYKR